MPGIECSVSRGRLAATCSFAYVGSALQAHSKGSHISAQRPRASDGSRAHKSVPHIGADATRPATPAMLRLLTLLTLLRAAEAGITLEFGTKKKPPPQKAKAVGEKKEEEKPQAPPPPPFVSR